MITLTWSRDRKAKKKNASSYRPKLDVEDQSCKNLKIFPMNIYSKVSLVRFLYLQDNQLTRLPSDLFTKLQCLEWLDIRNNRITVLPQLKGHKRQQENKKSFYRQLIGLFRLRCILAENNELVSLPGDIWTAGNLSTLSLSNNNLDEVDIIL